MTNDFYHPEARDKRRDELLTILRADYPLDSFYRARARVINEARANGATWRQIALALDLTEVGIQRAPYVDSPWNRRMGKPTDPNEAAA